MQYIYFPIDLQLFADGGDGGAPGASADAGFAAATNGVKGQSAADSTDADVTVEAPDRNVEFERLIKGEYKDLYDARVQETIQKRLKGTKETVDKYNALTPTIDLLARKYGVKADDIEGLGKAIEADDTFFEDEALERGMTVEQLKEVRRMERENADLKRQMQERETEQRANELYASWMRQAEETKGVYPSFDLDAEMGNPKFIELLRSNIDVRTAYEVVHKDDIIRGAMQFTANEVGTKLSNKMRANAARPQENGTSGQSASTTSVDIANMTKAQRRALGERAAHGERITFK